MRKGLLGFCGGATRAEGAAMSVDEPTSDESGSEELDDSSDDLEEVTENEDKPPQYMAFVVMTCVIGGYTLIGPLQHHLKVKLGIEDAGTRSEVFTQSVAMVQWGKTFMTLGQNVLLGCISPVKRVYIAMNVMAFGTFIPPAMIYGLGNNWIGWVPLSYLSIGFALGVFECTYLSVLVPLGPRTKSVAIMGFPAAFAIVNIVGQSLMQLFHLPVSYIFWYIFFCQPVAIFMFRKMALVEDKGDSGTRTIKQAGILQSLRDWKEWVPRMIPFCLVNIVNHFVMESILPAIFNTYNGCVVSVWGPEDKSLLMSTVWFIVILSLVMAIGDMSSRRIGFIFAFDTYKTNFMGLAFALSCSILGLLLTSRGVASLTWFAAFLAFFGSGFNYAVTAKYIDKFVPSRHNLAGYSLWMFVGYCGAISGAVLVSLVREWICDAHAKELYKYQCLAHHPSCH